MEGVPKPTSAEMPHSTERKLHEERWQKEAARSNWINQQTAEDRMLIEADRDNADYNQRQTPEFKAWATSLVPVVANFKERASNPESKRKTLIFIMGGGMKAAYAAGQVSALNELGITADKVDFVVGASAGAVVATAYVGGPQQTKQGTAMMRGPLSHRDFINTTSVGRFIGGNVINLPYIQSLMEEGPYALDQDAIKQSSAELHYIVTEPAVGKDPVVVRFLNAKTLPSMTDGITATMSIPYLTGPIPRIDGEKFLDGAFSPLPIKEIISQFPSVTDILILPQNPFMPSEQLDPHLFSKMFSELLDSTPLGKINQLHQMEKYLMASKTLRESLEEIQTMSGVNIGVMWPPDDALHTTNIDGDRATAAVIASHRDTVRVLGGVQPEVVSLDESSNRHSSHDDSKRAA